MHKLVFIALLSFIGFVISESLGRGFGDDINWVPYADAFVTARLNNKPIFLLIHNTWCKACLDLQKELRDHPDERKEIVELSRQFVMVNVVGKEEPNEEEYSPDGRYTPRILFLDANGKRIRGVNNLRRHKYYLNFYDRAEDIIRAMKESLAAVKRTRA
uniref:Thioredoxin domain-containing protein 12 n=1 Tax=Ascaris suum TaxID=6253 RepID=F1L356_ASCSU